MKSEIAIQTKCRPEGRIFPRRKVASKAHLLNGDFEMELSLAIQESLKYARQRDEELNEKDCGNSKVSVDTNNQSDVINKDKGHGNTDEGGDSSASMTQSVTMEEVSRLKDLLLAHTELIQCQQEEILQKDNELRLLRVENDALQCRLERMERRLSMLKHKEESLDTMPPSKPADHKTKQLVPIRHSNDLKRQHESQQTNFKKRRRRNLGFSPKKKRRWQNTLVKSTPNSHSISKSQDTGAINTGEEEDGDEGGSSEGEEEEEDQDSGTGEDDGGSDRESADGKSNEENEEEKRTVIDYPILQTETDYHFYYPKHLCSSPDSKKLQERALTQLEVETPSWRLLPLTSKYQLEGTENITDEAYFKRHQKFELEEKRRKRWDLQRIRELRVFEKFEQQKESEMLASPDEVDVETFLPSIHSLTHIEITDSIPVMAFGQPIPCVSPGEFEIPWDMSKPGPSTSTSSSSRYRTTSSSSGTRRH